MAKRHKQTFLQRRHGKPKDAKRFRVLSHQENASKTTMRHHFPPTRATVHRIKKTIILNVGEVVEKLEPLCVAESKMAQSFWKSLAVPHTLELPLDTAIRLLGVYPGGLKAYVHTEAYLQMFTAARLLTAKK